MEDNLKGRRPHRNTTSEEDDHTGRPPHRKMTSREEDLTGIQVKVNGLASQH